MNIFTLDMTVVRKGGLDWIWISLDIDVDVGLTKFNNHVIYNYDKSCKYDYL